jgi:hypothetical protein
MNHCLRDFVDIHSGGFYAGSFNKKPLLSITNLKTIAWYLKI